MMLNKLYIDSSKNKQQTYDDYDDFCVWCEFSEYFKFELRVLKPYEYFNAGKNVKCSMKMIFN